MSKLSQSDRDTAKMLRDELTKVRCWVSGFCVGRSNPGNLGFGIPGEDSLRQTIIFIDKLLETKS